MIQTLSILMFLLIAGGGTVIIAASLIDDWGAFTNALGFGRAGTLAPLPPQVRATGSRQARVVRFACREADRRVAA